MVEALRRCFPEVETIEVRAEAGTGSAAEQQRALQQTAHDDPEVKRIIQTLGAEVELVTPIRDDAT